MNLFRKRCTLRNLRSILLLAVLTACFPVLVSPQSSPPKPATASVTGRVTLGDQPVKGATIMLLRDNYYPPGDYLQKTVTDDDGRYRLTGIAAGTYRVSAIAPGFVVPTEARGLALGKRVTLDDNENLEGIDLALKRGAVITGRVTDASGQPLIEADVRLRPIVEKVSPSSPASTIPPAPVIMQSFTTDDRGIYRIYGLPAGHYKVSVGVDPQAGSGIGAISTTYPLTFHPDTTEEAKATIVEVEEGGEAANIDIKVGTPLQTYRASGHIVDADTGKPVAGVFYNYGTVINQWVNSGGYIGNRTDARGAFTIDGIVPGNYAAFIVNLGDQDGYCEPVPFEIKDANVTGLEIKVRRGASITGTVIAEGTDDPEILASIQNLYLSVEISQTTPGVLETPQYNKRIAPDGSFRVSGLRPGKGRIRVYGIQAKRHPTLLRVEQNGNAIESLDLKEREQITGVRVVIGFGTGAIRVIIKSEDGVVPPNLRIMMQRRGQPGNNSPPGYIPGYMLDGRGNFTFNNLLAGEYELTLILPGSQRNQKPLVQTVSVANNAETQVTFNLEKNN